MLSFVLPASRCAPSIFGWFRVLSLLAALDFARAQDVTFNINATQDRHTIPAEVYGSNELGYTGSTVIRHGGNRHTGLNWENNASNAGSDYIHSSDAFLGSQAGIGSSQTPGALLQAWVNADRAAGQKSIITLPLAGYVAADMSGSVSAAQVAPSARWKQLVFDKPGALSTTPNTADGVVYLEEMVNFLVANYGAASAGGVAAYNLDNEPALWKDTHPRIHPNAVGYAELVSRNTAAATVATALDPGAQIYGPTLYGWSAHLNLQNAPDAGSFNPSFGNFTNYYLAQMNAASTNAGRRLLHRFDMHWYPEARGDHRIVFEGATPSYGTNNDIDARLQAPRSLWDASYVETSWITQYTTNGQGIRLLPRLAESAAQYFPGTGLAMTEYNYGGTEHISGGVAQADVLGILGRYQTAGCFWPLTNDNSYVVAAFKLYRNYDNAGATFGAVSLDATASDNARAGIHAARSGAKLTTVAINRSRTQARTAQFNFALPAGRSISALRVYRMSPAGGAQIQAISPAPAFTANNLADALPAMSATLYEVQMNAGAGFPEWQQAQFGAQAGNATIAGPDADPDRDGLRNYLEYVTVRNPQAVDPTSPLLAESAGTVAQPAVRLRFQRRKDLANAVLTIETSTSLAANSWTSRDPATLQPAITSVDAQTEIWTITLPISAGTTREFYRLKAAAVAP